jgi:hypothetical protein
MISNIFKQSTFLRVNSFPLITQCSSMDQAVSLAVRSRRFESSFFKPCKVNLNTRRGEALCPHTYQPSPSIPHHRPHKFNSGHRHQCLRNSYPQPTTASKHINHGTHVNLSLDITSLGPLSAN